MTRSITRGKNLLFVPEGGVEIPEVRDSDYSVTLVLRVGTTATTGMHWHEKKTGMKEIHMPFAPIWWRDSIAVRPANL